MIDTNGIFDIVSMIPVSNGKWQLTSTNAEIMRYHIRRPSIKNTTCIVNKKDEDIVGINLSNTLSSSSQITSSNISTVIAASRTKNILLENKKNPVFLIQYLRQEDLQRRVAGCS